MTTAAALAVLVVIVAVLAAAVDAGYFRGPLIRFLAARTGRLVQIEGHLEAHHDRDVNAAKNILAAVLQKKSPPSIGCGRTSPAKGLHVATATYCFDWRDIRKNSSASAFDTS